MKITAISCVNSKTIKNNIIAATATAAAALGINLRKNEQKTNYDKDIGIIGRASAAEVQAMQNITKSGLDINPNATIAIVTGSSGVGKNTILKVFLDKHPEFKHSVSHTTRKQRPNEVDGVDYYFVSDEEFYRGIENGEFIEWVNFSGNHYGTKKSTVENMLKKTNKLILILETKGALKVKKLIPQAKLIFISPPSVEELETRLRGRGTESEESIQKRLGAIKTEMKDAKKFDYQIVNDTIDNAVASLEKIFDIN